MKCKDKVIVNEPMCLVLHEKNGNYYFHIVDDQDLFRTALMILTERLKSGNFYYDPSEDSKPEDPGITQEQVDQFPEGVAKLALQREVSSFKNRMRAWQFDKDQYEQIKKIVKSKNAKGAWIMLQDHSDGEYERISLQNYEINYFC
jgi:hypothetical protein